MNSLAHIFFAQLLFAYGLPQHSNQLTLLLAGAAGIVLDLDHASARHLRRALKTKRFGPGVRTRWHETGGLAVFASIGVAVGFFSPALAGVILVGLVSHQVLDFLTRPTRPFYPEDETQTMLDLAPSGLKRLVLYDSAVTTALGIVWLATPSVQDLLRWLVGLFTGF